MNAIEKALIKKVLDFVMTHLEAHADKLNTPVGKDVEALLKDITTQLEDALAKM